jgi:hypothetical protein
VLYWKELGRAAHVGAGVLLLTGVLMVALIVTQNVMDLLARAHGLRPRGGQGDVAWAALCRRSAGVACVWVMGMT